MNVCDCPHPPGGAANCPADNLAVCRIVGGQVKTYCLPPSAAISGSNVRRSSRDSVWNEGTTPFFQFVASLINGSKGGTLGKKKVRGSRNKSIFGSGYVTPSEVERRLSSPQPVDARRHDGESVALTFRFPGSERTYYAAVGTGRKLRLGFAPMKDAVDSKEQAAEA